MELIYMGKVQTSVMIDEEKRQLAKAKGLKLQDLLDEALNRALSLDVPGQANLELEKEQLLNDLQILEKQKEDYLQKHDQQVNEINFKLSYIDNKLTKHFQDKEEMEKEKQFNYIIERAKHDGEVGQELQDIIKDYILTYGVDPEEMVKKVNYLAYGQ